MKKAFKIIGITLLILVALLIAIPFAFQSQIKTAVKQLINENLNAKVEFSDVNLSFLSSFPQAQVSVNDLVVTNLAPFKDETFASVKSISFDMSIPELFKTASGEPIVINSIYVNEALITLKTNKLGIANYDITKTDASTSKPEIEAETTNASGFSLDIKDYAITNSAITYIDETSNIAAYVTSLNHSGKGVFSGDVSELDTNTELLVSLSMDSTKYLNNNSIKLDALIGLDLTNNKYSFKENKLIFNKLPIEFQGYVQLLENGQDIDISFENPGSTFKDFLAVIPNQYTKDLDNVETTGGFKIKGLVKGLMSETTIPLLDINFISNQASFKYPDLPKRVEDIAINVSLKNDNGNLDDTYLNIDAFNFKVDQDVFKSAATIKNITKNILVNANMDGTLNLANLTKAYPIELDNELSGILKAKLSIAFDMNAIETNAYQHIKSDGSFTLNDFVFSSEDVANPIHINKADLTFSPETVSLNTFEAKTGTSDLNASGTINNLLGFLLSDGKLKGNFKLNSSKLAVNDFMSEDNPASTTNEDTSETNKETTSNESLKIPAFLDCTIQADAKTVLYDNLTLKNVKGLLRIKDQQVSLENITTNMFDGILALSGLVNTKEETPVFNANLNIKSFDISESFNQLELLQSIAPIAKALQGKLNTTIKLSGSLDKELSPDLSTVSGDAFAELLTTKIEPKNAKLVSALNGAIDFIDFEKLDLKDLKTKLTFENGQVQVKPFNLKYEDIDISVGGSHGFDQSMNYNATFNVPAKYLGSDINRLIGKIDDDAVNDITIPVTANIVGTFTKPTVKTDLTSGVANLTKQLIEIEKQKLVTKGKDKVKDLIGDMFNNDTKPTSNSAANAGTDGTKTKQDSTKTAPNKQVEEGIKNALGNFFNKNKKKKDSVN